MDETIDWTGCEFVEQVPGRMSGVPVVIRSRVTPEAVVDNFDDDPRVGSIVYMFGLPRKHVIGVLRYAGRLAETPSKAA